MQILKCTDPESKRELTEMSAIYIHEAGSAGVEVSVAATVARLCVPSHTDLQRLYTQQRSERCVIDYHRGRSESDSWQ